MMQGGQINPQMMQALGQYMSAQQQPQMLPGGRYALMQQAMQPSPFAGPLTPAIGPQQPVPLASFQQSVPQTPPAFSAPSAPSPFFGQGIGTPTPTPTPSPASTPAPTPSAPNQQWVDDTRGAGSDG